MNSLRARLFGAIALTVAICVALTVVVGIVLTRRAVDRSALRDLSHQADLIAGAQSKELSPLTHLPDQLPFPVDFKRSGLANSPPLTPFAGCIQKPSISSPAGLPRKRPRCSPKTKVSSPSLTVPLAERFSAFAVQVDPYRVM